MPLANEGELRALNGVLNGVFISLHTGAPGNTGANEIAGGAYARQPLGAYTLTGNNPTIASNNNVIQFPQATTNWGTITHFGVWSLAAGGLFVGGDPVTIARDILQGDAARWDPGNLQFEAN